MEDYRKNFFQNGSNGDLEEMIDQVIRHFFLRVKIIDIDGSNVH